MKRAASILAAAFLSILGALGVATFVWTAWVIWTGGGWLLALTFNAGSETAPSLELWSASAVIACLSFWAAARILRKSKSLVHPT